MAPDKKFWLQAVGMSVSANVEAVGNYAIRIIFDDLHDTGIFSWRYLYQLGAERDLRWPEYVSALEAAGLSRDP